MVPFALYLAFLAASALLLAIPGPKGSLRHWVEGALLLGAGLGLALARKT